MSNDKKMQRIEPIKLDLPKPQDPISKILEDLKKNQDEKAIRLSFDIDPVKTDNSYSSVYRRRTNLMPPAILKRIRDSEELVGGVILPIRARQAALFARPRANRFDVGLTFTMKPEAVTKFSDEQQEKVKEEIIPKLREFLLNCGRTDGIKDKDKRNLSQLFVEIVEDLLTFGAFAIELRKDGVGRLHSFRAVDAGTIYFTTAQKGESQEAENIRLTSRRLLQQLQGFEDVDFPKFENDEYTYVQVIEDIPKQVFTDDELLYWGNSPSTDINRSGYPVSPIERVVAAITTHINLTTQNKMYFINGHAYKNILVFKSNNLEEGDIASIRAQMIGHINSANAAHRQPVFGMGPEDSVEVVQLDPGNRDMEFQYLADLNKRMIFAAFQMSPDEAAALSYLSRGTNNQAMSESNNEWKLTAARDTGLRPLLISLEDFMNERLLPKINEEWSKIIRINIEGLDSESPEKEATRLEQDSAIFLTMNDILERVEKEDVPIGGDFPLNPAYVQVLEKYYTKGQILKAFGGPEFINADKDPDLQFYMADQAWLQLQGMKMSQQASAQQSQQNAPQQNQELSNGEDLDSAISQLHESLGKSEKALPKTRKELLKRHTYAKKKIMKDFEKDSKEMVESIMSVLDGKESDEDHEH